MITLSSHTDKTSGFRSVAAQPRVRSAVSWAFFALALIAWLLFLRPVELGGPISVVSVNGTSMEPMLHTGDLVVARQQANYEVGDLVVFSVDDGTVRGRVIHRIIAEPSPGQWTTQGDNRATPDPWTVSNDNLLGAYWFHIPALGNIAQLAAQQPLLAGVGAALLVSVAFIPFRRKKLSPALATALEHAEREPFLRTHTRDEYVVLALGAIGTLAALSGFLWVYMSRSPNIFLWLLAGTALLGSGGFTTYWVKRLFDGATLAEPQRSLAALSGRLWLVDELPTQRRTATAVRSAIELRELAERRRLPILHHHDVATGRHEFVLITADDENFYWSAEAPTAQ